MNDIFQNILENLEEGGNLKLIGENFSNQILLG